MGNSTDKRIINLPLITSGSVTSTLVLPVEGTTDDVTKKINLGQIKTFVLSGSTSIQTESMVITTSFTPSTSGDTSGVVGQLAWDANFIYVKTSTGWGRSPLDYGF